MGAFSPPDWGGRWSAVYSLCSYVHRLLRVFGVASVDTEEVALLSGALVRLRLSGLVLAHHPDALHPDEPLGWLPPSAVPPAATLFFLHFDSSDHAHPDRARLATAAAGPASPRAWLAVDLKTGHLRLAVSEPSAALFCLRPARDGRVSLALVAAPSRFLSAHPASRRARLAVSPPPAAHVLLINHVPLPPSLPPAPPPDCSMAAALAATRPCPVRIQSAARLWFLASKPGAPLAAAAGKDAGWDGFTLEYDSLTRTAKLRDSRGLYLVFAPALDALIAAPDPDADQHHACDADADTAEEPRAPENFAIDIVADDDRVVLRSRKGYLSARGGGKIVLSKDTVPGKREQFYLRLALPSMMDESKPRLRLRAGAGGARHVEASVLVPAHARIAYEVLCDYDGFSDFISDASESRMLERKSDSKLTVLMVQCHSFLMLTIPMTMVLDVTEEHEERIVTMDLKRGLGVKQYKGVWQAVERADGRCLIRCSLLASTAVPAPGFLIDGLMSHATMSTMEQLRTECIRRSSLDQPKPPRRRHRTLSIDSPVLPKAPSEVINV